MKTIIKARKIGGSLIVTIPREIVEIEGIKENQFVEIEIQRPKKSFFGISKKISPFSKEDKFKGQIDE